MTKQQTFTVIPSNLTELVSNLAAYAALPLEPSRQANVAAILSVWIPNANALSTKMSAAQYQSLVPATLFTHPATPEAEAKS
jgi:hypothetical protein